MPGRPGHYDLSEIHAWWRDYGPGKKRTAAVSSEDDPLLADGDSPGLERYRLAKAAIAELDLEERKKSLLSRDTVRMVLSRWGSILRRVGERFQKTCPEAASALCDALDECDHVIGYELGDSANDDGAK